MNTNSINLSRFAATVMIALAACRAAKATDADPEGASTQPAWPVQLEAVVPFEPTPFKSGGRTHLVYEILLRNFTAEAVTARRIEVFDADAKAASPLAVFEGESLDALFEPIVYTPAPETKGLVQLPPGASGVVFLWISSEPGAPAPKTLRHRVLTVDNVVEGPVIGTRTLLQVLAPPVTGKHWLGADAPSNEAENHHRRGLLAFDGRATIDRRFAVDWKQVENGASFTGDKLDKHAYYAYGKPLFAVADARVVSVNDGLPDNVPGHNEAFHPAIPITFATICGNRIVLDLGHGQFAHYFHLQAGSLQVKAGDRVRRGQLIARVGNSGDAREPHLHFEVTTSSKPIDGEGVPYVIDEYQWSAAGARPAERHTRELPLNNEIVDFR